VPRAMTELARPALAIGVMGFATEPIEESAIERARALGRARLVTFYVAAHARHPHVFA
jgi:hypothetical protein